MTSIRSNDIGSEPAGAVTFSGFSPNVDTLLHRFSFKLPTQLAEMNETSDAGCAFEMRNVVKSAKKVSKGYEYNVLSFAQKIDGIDDAQTAYSVVTNSDQSRVFAYMAPRQTQSVEEFVQGYSEGDVVEVRQTVEGTMITFFWNPEIDEWDICTRNGVGGNYSYSQPIKLLFPVNDYPRHCLFDPRTDKMNYVKTFREMVLDVFRMKCLVEMGEYKEIRDFADIPFLADLPKDCFYTCILRHAENHIVYDTLRHNMQLQLLSASEVSDNHCVRAMSDSNTLMIAQSVFGSQPQIPYQICTKTELIESPMLNQTQSKHEITYEELNDPDSVFHPPAWILMNSTTGKYVEIANVHYQRAKELRNMQPNLRYLWLTMRHDYSAYLNAFPQYTRLFYNMEIEFSIFVNRVHEAYVNFYILKIRDTIIPKKYFVHAARIHHSIYLPSIQAGRKRSIKHETVFEYFNQFTPSRMFYFLTKPEEEQQPAVKEQPSVKEQWDQELQ